MSDYYAVLGIDRNASAAEIKRAHRRKAMQHHPDVGGDGVYILKVNCAWEVLGDPDKKRVYDQQSQASSNRWSSSHSRPSSSGQQASSRASSWQGNSSNSQTKTRTESRQSTSRPSSNTRSAQAYESVGKGTFRRICTCGCRGYPMTHLAGVIDFVKYSTCPARELRKRCGFYYNDSGSYVSWNSAKTSRWRKRNEARRNPEATSEARRKAKKIQRDARKASRDAVVRQEEANRIKNRMEPLSPAEARRRDLKYYRSKPCKYGHDSLRDLKSNCLRCRELEKLKRASEKISL